MARVARNAIYETESEGNIPLGQGELCSLIYCIMRYLIKLEDRENGREAFVECPARMSLEEFSVKVKLELQFPLTGHHCFLSHGKVYISTEITAVSDLWGFYMDAYLPFDVQDLINYPSEKDVRDTERYRLNQVFTVLGSAITFDLKTYSEWYSARCTLIKRL